MCIFHFLSECKLKIAIGYGKHASIAVTKQFAMVHAITGCKADAGQLMRLIRGFDKQEVAMHGVAVRGVEVAKTLLVCVEHAIAYVGKRISLNAEVHGCDAIVIAHNASIMVVDGRE